jgi:hypothetical protein
MDEPTLGQVISAYLETAIKDFEHGAVADGLEMLRELRVWVAKIPEEQNAKKGN